MPIEWVLKITKKEVDSANYALSTFDLSVGETRKLAEFYEVDIRTIQRWFTTGKQRRNCIPRRAVGERLSHIGDDEPLRERCILPFTLAVPGGIKREPPTTGKEARTTIKAERLAIALTNIDQILYGEHNDFLEHTWRQIFTVVDRAGGWTVHIWYRRPLDYDELKAVRLAEEERDDTETEEEDEE